MTSWLQKKKLFQGTQERLGRVCCKAESSQKFLDWEQASIKHKETGDNCFCVLHSNPPYSEFLDLRHSVFLFLIWFDLRHIKLTGITLKTPLKAGRFTSSFWPNCNPLSSTPSEMGDTGSDVSWLYEPSDLFFFSPWWALSPLLNIKSGALFTFLIWTAPSCRRLSQ